MTRNVSRSIRWLFYSTFLTSGLLALSAPECSGADQPQWGRQYSRNMVSDETGLPSSFDPETGRNVIWTAPLGTETNATPVVAGGKILIGTNNGQPRDPRHDRYRGVLMCLDQRTGKLDWQLVVPRFEDRRYLDWKTGGICGAATVDGERVYVVTNRDEVVCLDLKGQANGNQGPYLDEGRHMVPAGAPPLPVTLQDADILWIYDLPKELGVHPHDSPSASILIDGRFLYLNTSNGVDRVHSGIPAPEAPSLIVLDKRSGKLVAKDQERIGPRVFHCTWSSPALAVIDGERRIYFCGGDGICYAFRALDQQLPVDGNVRALQRVWRFDCDPSAPKRNVHQYMRNRRESPSTMMGMPVIHDQHLYVAGGGDIWWGKKEAWIKCIDARGQGDVTSSALLWSSPLDDHTCCTPAIADGLVFTVDFGRNIRCHDAQTGQVYWTERTRGPGFGSALIADGKVYIGAKDRRLRVFAASREKQVLATVELDSPMISTPVAADKMLYITTFETLYAIKKTE